MNINPVVLIEIKKEYSIQFINIVTPLIYEGLKSLYDDAVEIGNGKDTLLVYQSLLKRIPKWSSDLIAKETQRIREQSKCSEWFDDLIRAAIKSNIDVLLIGCENKENIVSSEVDINDFIHKCYIQCGREMFNSPYLMYHKSPLIEIKKNQKECCNIIREAIKDAIRKMIPFKHILSNYLKKQCYVILDDKKIPPPIENPVITNESDMMNKIKDLAQMTETEKKSDLQEPKVESPKMESVKLDPIKLNELENIIGTHDMMHSLYNEKKNDESESEKLLGLNDAEFDGVFSNATANNY